MKKLFSILLCLAIVFSLCSCSLHIGGSTTSVITSGGSGDTESQGGGTASDTSKTQSTGTTSTASGKTSSEFVEVQPTYKLDSLDGSLDNTYYKLTHDKDITVGYVGGSVTVGSGSSGDNWRTLTQKWMKTEFGAKVHELTCMGGGISSVWNCAIYEKEILEKKPDLVFIESSINDYLVGNNSNNGGYPKKDESAIILDTMIRRTWALCPNCDIIFVTVVNKDTLKGGNVNAEGHKATAKLENIMYLDVTDVVWQLVGKEFENWKPYFSDEVHPKQKGYIEYANYINAAVAKKFEDSKKKNITKLTPHKAAAKAYSELVPDRFERIDVADLNESVYKDTKWAFSKTENHVAYGDYMLKATESGAVFTYEFTGATTFGMLGVFQKGANMIVTMDGAQPKNLATSANAGQMFLYKDLDPKKKHTVQIIANGNVVSPSIRCEINCFVLGRKG